jgi:hypothetical protein
MESMMSPLGPWARDARASSDMGICRVRKTCKIIKLTSASLLESTQKGMASLMVIVQVRS